MQQLRDRCIRSRETLRSFTLTPARAPLARMAQAFDLFRQADSETPVSPSGSEDFSTFTNVILGCFVFVNGGDADDGRPDMNHHPRFNLVQSSLAAGVKTEVQIVLDVLGVG